MKRLSEVKEILLECGYTIEKDNDMWMLTEGENEIILCNKYQGELLEEACKLLGI